MSKNNERRRRRRERVIKMSKGSVALRYALTRLGISTAKTNLLTFYEHDDYCVRVYEQLRTQQKLRS